MIPPDIRKNIKNQEFSGKILFLIFINQEREKISKKPPKKQEKKKIRSQDKNRQLCETLTLQE